MDPLLERSARSAAFAQSFGGFHLCYQRGLARDASLSGTVRVRFVIAPDGGRVQVVYPMVFAPDDPANASRIAPGR